MIAWLEGRLLRKASDHVVVADGGVGYRVFVTRQVLERLPPEGERVALEIHTQVREDAIQLFGFLEEVEREIFEALIGMSGIGPRAAMGILSGMDARELAHAVCSGDLARLCTIQGVGKKKAERMCLDLRDRLLPLAHKPADERAADILGDLRSALGNLGFKGAEIEQVVGSMRKRVLEQPDLDVLLPEALKLLRG